MFIQGLYNCKAVVTRFRFQRPFLNQRVNFFFIQLDAQAPQPIALSLSVAAHSFGGKAWRRGH
jgi:hypothetical protein